MGAAKLRRLKYSMGMRGKRARFSWKTKATAARGEDSRAATTTGELQPHAGPRLTAKTNPPAAMASSTVPGTSKWAAPPSLARGRM